MITDAHCHPWDFAQLLGGAEPPIDVETELRQTGTACATSAWNQQQFEYHELLSAKARKEGAPPVFCCFALHPQLPASSDNADFSPEAGLEFLHSVASGDRLHAVGEAGFDLYSDEFKAAEKLQDELFVRHLEVALQYGLPMVLHLRRAMHKVFPFTSQLKKLPAVVFHSWPGTVGDGQALLRRGVNAFFSFGATVLKNHRATMACATLFPPDRILFETDAPYQPLRGRDFSSWRDLPQVCQSIATLRKQAHSSAADPELLQEITTANFFRAFDPESHVLRPPPPPEG